uniref:Reverse transcriptase domain-containing protein n=1 Tax=Trichogramma kaykai TaxID=54128 RepID=A0ABD2WMC7_9HYME
MSRLKAPRTSPPTAPDLVRRAVSMFPSVIPRLIGAPPVLEEHLIPEVGVEELRWAYRHVRNAFNSARWDKILSALSQMEVPAYLQRMVLSYFRGRVLEFTTDDGAETYEVTAGMPQGSVLGPILWNVMYDRILRLELPRSAKIVGFADDIAITVVAKHLDLVEYYSNETIRLVRAALTELGLQTADQKTEVLLVTSRKVTETITVRAGDHYITSAPCIRYLGVHIDARLRFEEHLRIVSDKENRVAGALLGLMPNIGGPRSSRRRLYASVVDSILLYGAPAWSEAVKKQSYARQAVSIHRRACLRVICGFCSISHEATYFLASIPPLTLLIDERSRLFLRRLENVESEERAKTIEEWQAQWTCSRKGRWTHRLIPNIIPWIERRHGEVTSARYVRQRWRMSNTSFSAALDSRRKERYFTTSLGVPWSLIRW